MDVNGFKHAGDLGPASFISPCHGRDMTWRRGVNDSIVSDRNDRPKYPQDATSHRPYSVLGAAVSSPSRCTVYPKPVAEQSTLAVVPSHVAT